MQPVHIIGGGLAGSEAAWQIARRGVPVVLHEMRPERTTAAHKTDRLAELVCSNSFRSDDRDHNAVGLLHEEMRRLGSLVMRAADANQVPAGGALAVDRDGFCAGGDGGARIPPADRDRARRNRRAAARRLGQRHRGDRPAHLAGACRRDPGGHGRGRARLLRRHRADRASRLIDMGVAWFQSRYDRAGPGGTGDRLHQLPARPRPVRSFLDALLAADRVVSRMGGARPISTAACRSR